MQRLIVATGVCCALSAALVWADDKKDAGKKAADKKWVFLDLQPQANQKLKENFHYECPNAPNSLGALPTGEQALAGVKFKVGESCIQLGSKRLTDKPEKVEGIKVDKKFTKLHILHASGFALEAAADTIVGEYTVKWDDGNSVSIPIVWGKDILDWWYKEDGPEPTRAKVAWKGENEFAKGMDYKIRLYLMTWENTKPDKKVVSIDFSSTMETDCAPFCVAMTAEEK
ncbi:MAG: hypothetical protein E6K70_00155 [Planctomycetota bacterium]|nr:MAG: hypothetical protein E6K70_00155 [Planctomycetota bacterium]